MWFKSNDLRLRNEVIADYLMFLKMKDYGQYRRVHQMQAIIFEITDLCLFFKALRFESTV